MADRKETIDEVKRLVSAIPSDVGRVVLGEDQYEFKIEVLPKSPRHCNFTLMFSTYGTYGLCFGNGLAFEDILVDEYPPKDVVQAIMQGKVRETVWRAGHKVTKSVGEIQLADGRLLRDSAFLSVRGNLGIGQKEQVSYEPFIES
jgi:hypothetical protein